MTEQIFIGGTGRSGTTILSKVLGKHREIFRYPFETRYIIDPDGLVDLVPSLSTEWSPWKGDTAVRRFKRMMWELYPPPLIREARKAMRLVLPAIGVTPPRYPLKACYADIMPRKEYLRLVDDFLDQLVYVRMKGFWAGSAPYSLKPRIHATRRFGREEIMELSRELANSLSSYAMAPRNKKIWLDHTPFNLIHASFLHEMFPDMKLIHVYRDMRDVISSYKTKTWGGNSAHDNAYWIKNILEKWEEEKEKIPSDLYYEVRMENLIREPESELKKITDFLNVDFDRKMMEIDLTKGHVGRWKQDLKTEEIVVVNEILGEILERYGYKE